MTLHLYRSPDQPATRFVDVVATPKGLRRIWHRHRARSLVTTFCCGRRRWAGRCTVQVYYDGIRFFCRDGRGCQA